MTGTNEYFRKVASKFGLKISFVDCSKTKLLEAAITPETKLVWVETLTNPSLKMIDIEACARIVHKHGDIILVVDNTFMSAYFQRPLALGADICMYSATKYMNGKICTVYTLDILFHGLEKISIGLDILISFLLLLRDSCKKLKKLHLIKCKILFILNKTMLMIYEKRIKIYYKRLCFCPADI
nr:cystathionine gamma-lyase-like [Microcebus murinus]